MKIIVIGAGSIGQRHLKNLGVLGYRDITVVDTNRGLLKNLQKEYKCYRDLKSALASEEPEIAFICTPTHLHIKQARLALEAGCHVFIEKPISNKADGIDQLRVLAIGKVVMVACNWRFSKAFRVLEKVLESGNFGKVLYARIAAGYFLPSARPGADYKKIYAAKRNEGGVLLDSGSHVVNYLIALFGDIHKIYYLKNSLGSLRIESDEIVHILIEHSNGVTCDISLDYVSRKSTNRIEIICEKGILDLDLVDNLLTFEDGKRKDILFNERLDPNQMFIDELEYFFKCIKTKSKPLQGIDEARKVLEILLSKNAEL